MITPKKRFSDGGNGIGAIKEYVKLCEDDFERRLSKAVETVRKTAGIKLIALSGPTCSGKTTLSKKLISNFAEYGRTVHTISIDNFYHPKDYLEERSRRLGLETVDYDSVDTIDIEELRECVREIFTEDETLVPIYDFNVGRSVGYEKFEYTDGELFIFEGIQAVYPEITALFKSMPHASMVIRPASPLDFGDVRFEPNEIRLMRRLVRDAKFRSTSPEMTFTIWDGVRSNEEKNIFPYIDNCDVKIDSTIPYEIGILAPHLEEILPLVPKGSAHYGKAREILEKISGFEHIPDSFIGENALYHEFVG